MKDSVVVKIASGSDHLVCLTKEGLIYTLGELCLQDLHCVVAYNFCQFTNVCSQCMNFCQIWALCFILEGCQCALNTNIPNVH